MWIIQHLPYPSGMLARPFQLALNASIQCAAELMRQSPLPPLYTTQIRFAPEPWEGSGVEEFADPWTVYARGWGDCDDLVIYRAAELVAAGFPAHARILRDVATNRYHSQVARDFDNRWEDPSLQRLGRPWLFSP